MEHVLLIYYSQSGEVAEAARIFAEELTAVGAKVTLAPLHPTVVYPHPWRSVRRFFDVMPESVLGLPPPIRPPAFDPSTRFDLVILAYPVWFLSPALPIQAFFRLPHAEVFRGADTLTITVSRAMWQRGSEKLKKLLRTAGAVHVDNIVVTHQGSPLATLVSTPRALLFGKKDQLLGVFPKAGVADSEKLRVAGLARKVARKLRGGPPRGQSMLHGEPALSITRWLVVPELLASYCFHGAAVIILALGRAGPAMRAAGVYAFPVFLLLLILVGLPFTALATMILSPLLRKRLDAYVERLAAPTGLAGAVEETE